eukprot:5940268-Pleurochrysis_carterae.AAC.1
MSGAEFGANARAEEARWRVSGAGGGSLSLSSKLFIYVVWALLWQKVRASFKRQSYRTGCQQKGEAYFLRTSASYRQRIATVMDALARGRRRPVERRARSGADTAGMRTPIREEYGWWSYMRAL